jgi:hypothetical protein
MKKTAILCVLVLSLLVAGCGGNVPQVPTPTPPPANTEAPPAEDEGETETTDGEENEGETEPTEGEEGDGETETTDNEAASDDGAYPAPSGYPAPSAGGYPTPLPYPEGPEFTIDEPVQATDTEVTGSGPEGVPIELINITKNGAVIGRTTIEEDGTYTIAIDDEIGPRQMIGLQLGNIEGTDLDINDFMVGPGYVEYPFVGKVFTSTLVVEE